MSFMSDAAILEAIGHDLTQAVVSVIVETFIIGA